MSEDRVEKAGEDIRYLLDRGYKKDFAIKFVSEHYVLNRRERNLLSRIVYSTEDVESTKSKIRGLGYVSGRHLVIDGFSVLITLEKGLGGDDVFLCQDGLCRDNAMALSNYKINESTKSSADKLLETLIDANPKTVRWVFDSHITGSGRLAQYVMSNMEAAGLKGECFTSPSAKMHISKLNLLTATNDPELIKQLDEIIDIPSIMLLEEEPET